MRKLTELYNRLNLINFIEGNENLFMIRKTNQRFILRYDGLINKRVDRFSD